MNIASLLDALASNKVPAGPLTDGDALEYLKEKNLLPEAILMLIDEGRHEVDFPLYATLILTASTNMLVNAMNMREALDTALAEDEEPVSDEIAKRALQKLAKLFSEHAADHDVQSLRNEAGPTLLYMLAQNQEMDTLQVLLSKLTSSVLTKKIALFDRDANRGPLFQDVHHISLSNPNDGPPVEDTSLPIILREAHGQRVAFDLIAALGIVANGDTIEGLIRFIHTMDSVDADEQPAPGAQHLFIGKLLAAHLCFQPADSPSTLIALEAALAAGYPANRPVPVHAEWIGINPRHGESDTPLLVLATQGGHRQVVERLLRHRDTPLNNGELGAHCVLTALQRMDDPLALMLLEAPRLAVDESTLNTDHQEGQPKIRLVQAAALYAASVPVVKALLERLPLQAEDEEHVMQLLSVEGGETFVERFERQDNASSAEDNFAHRATAAIRELSISSTEDLDDNSTLFSAAPTLVQFLDASMMHAPDQVAKMRDQIQRRRDANHTKDRFQSEFAKLRHG